MSHPVVMLVHNNLELTKKATASILAQDVDDISIVFGDNGSTDGSAEWLLSTGQFIQDHGGNIGVSAAWNAALEWLFAFDETSHVLVVNNDVILPTWMFSTLLEYKQPFVSGISVGSMAEIATPPKYPSLSRHPDFSCFLIRRDAWEKVGPFDESMKHYASDNDWHVQAHKKGIRLYGTNTGFYHERSSTLRLAPESERAEIEFQANRDREVFFKKWGCMPWGAGYDALFT